MVEESESSPRITRRKAAKLFGAASLAPAALIKTAAQAQEPDAPEKVETPGELEARQLDEYARFLKTQDKAFAQGAVGDIMRLLQGIGSIWPPQQHSPEDRARVYGPFGNFFGPRDSKKLPIIPFRNSEKTLFYNLSRVGKQEMLTSARLEFLKSSKSDAGLLATLKRGIDVTIRKFASLGEYEEVPMLPLTKRSDAEMHGSRATLIGRAYADKETQDREERETVLVAGILLTPKELPALSRLIVESYEKRDHIGVDEGIRQAIAKNALLFLPALGHEPVGILAKGWSAVGAPLVNAEGELVGILSDVVVLSYEQKGEQISKVAFIIQGPDAIREAQ